MDAQGFLAALAPAVTDADARERSELTITLPALLDPDADLTEEQLAAVSGGCCNEDLYSSVGGRR
jgi:hypothetical protein